MAWHATLNLLALQLGWGIWLFPAAFAKLGWATCLASVLVMAVLTVYSGYLFTRLFLNTPGAVIFGDIGAQAAGSLGRNVVYCVVYSMAATRCVILHQAATDALSYVFPRDGVPSPWHSGGAVFLVVSVLAQVRSINELSWFFMIGTASQFAAMALVVYELLSFPASDPVYHAQAVRGDTLVPSVVALFNIVFAYGGQAGFVEIMAAMPRPYQFARSVGQSTGIITLVYLVVGVVGYRSLGAAVSDIVLFDIGRSPRVRLASCCILLQTMSQYLANLNLWTHNLLVLLARRGGSARCVALDKRDSSSLDGLDGACEDGATETKAAWDLAGSLSGKAGAVAGRQRPAAAAASTTAPPHVTGTVATFKAWVGIRHAHSPLAKGIPTDQQRQVMMAAPAPALRSTSVSARDCREHGRAAWLAASAFVTCYSFAISSAIPYFSSLVSLFSSGTFLVCAYVLPSWFTLRMLSAKVAWHERALLWALVPVCVALSVAGLYGSVQSLYSDAMARRKQP